MGFDEKINYLKKYKIIESRILFLESKENEEDSAVQNVNDIDKLKEMSYEIKSVIDAIEDITMRMILTYVYIDGLTLQTIADDHLIAYSYRQLRRLHYQAINELKINKETHNG